MPLPRALKAGALLILAAAVLLLGYALLQDFGNDECGLTEQQARDKVLGDLARRGLPANGLSIAKATGTCKYDYEYSGGGARLDYAVMSTWGQGIKIAWYDYAQDPQPQP
jgi:hypothetical protein